MSGGVAEVAGAIPSPRADRPLSSSLNGISSRSGFAAVTGPVGVEEFASGFVGAFVGMSAEIVSLSL